MKLSVVDSSSAFEDAVTEHFNFLEQEYGFRLSHIQQVGYTKIIKYESPLVYVNLMFGPPSYEPEMAFGRIGIDDVMGAQSFHPGDLVLLNGSANWKWGPVDPANSVLVENVSGIAQILRECGSACLRGDQASFEEMIARRNSAVKAWQQEEKSSQVRKEAQIAWDNKDYSAVIKLYESVYGLLTPAEKKKLSIAKKQLKRE